MRQITDKRRNVIIHEDATPEDLPVVEPPEFPLLPDLEPFVPRNMSEPRLYPGDVMVNVKNGRIESADFIYAKLDDGVLVVPLDSGGVEFVDDQQFSARFYRGGETHIYDGVAQATANWAVEFDETKLERPEPTRSR